MSRASYVSSGELTPHAHTGPSDCLFEVTFVEWHHSFCEEKGRGKDLQVGNESPFSSLLTGQEGM